MKKLYCVIVMAGALALSLAGSEVDQLKNDLVGQTMGGREKSWKFQSADQIKELVIKNKAESGQKRVYTIGLQLEAAPSTGRYTAEARVEYEKAVTGWKIKHVGLLSLRKLE